MPDGVTHHEDIITIILQGEEAKITLQELREMFQTLQAIAAETGATMDRAMTQIAVPIQQIAENTGIAVQELQLLRTQLAGMAAVAGAPATAAAGIREIGAAARAARVDLTYPLREIRAERLFPEEAAEQLYPLPPMRPEPIAPPAPPELPPIPTPELFERQVRLAFEAGDIDLMMRLANAYDQFARAQIRVTGEIDRSREAVGQFRGSFRRHVIWFAQGTIIYYAISTAINLFTDQISAAAQEMLVYQDAIARMRFITRESVADLDELAASARSVGVAFGLFPTEVTATLVEVTQASKDTAEQLVYLRDAAQWAFISGQELSEGLDDLIAVERVWNMEASEGTRILDIIALSYRVAKIPMEEMMATLERGGRIAESVGLPFEEYAATIAAVGEYSNLTASQVTTLMEAISARPFQPELAARFEREFGFLNIALFEPGTAGRQRRAVADIMDELVRQWGRLSAAQRQSVAEILVGRRLAAEFLTLMEAWQHVPEYVDEYSDSLGEASRLTEELMSKTSTQIDMARAAWSNLRTEIGLTIDQVFGVRSAVMDLVAALEVAARMQRIARGLPGEQPTLEEDYRRRLEEARRWQTRLAGPEAGRAMMELQLRGFAGARPPIFEADPALGFQRTTREQIQQWMQQFIDYYQEQLEIIAPTFTPVTEEDIRRMGRELEGMRGMPLSELYGVAGPREEAARLQAIREAWPGMLAGEIPFETWIREFDAVTNVLDAADFSMGQINAAQEESVTLVHELLDAWLATAAAMKGAALTTDEIDAVMRSVLDWANSQVVIIRDMSGELRIIQGQAAAFLSTILEAQQAQRARFDIQRLERVGPERWGELQQLAWQWQAYLQTLPGYDEEARQFYLVLADNVARPIVTTSTALRYAIEDLTEVERRQLEGMWNLPAGAVAYVPITSLFYQRQREAGPPGGVPMAGPPAGLISVPTAPDIGTSVAEQTYARFGPPLQTIIAKLDRMEFLPGEGVLPERERERTRISEETVRAYVERRGARRPWREEVPAEVTPRREDVMRPDPLGLQGIRSAITDFSAAMQGMREQAVTVTIPPIFADITLYSTLMLSGYVLARVVEREMGRRLSQTIRGYGTRGGGNAPRVMT